MNVLDDLRLGEVQQIVVALEVLAVPILEPLAAKCRLVQLVLLDHRAHRAVEDDDAFAQQTLRDVQFCPASVGCKLTGQKLTESPCDAN